ncbi:hypothetical protein AB0E83_33340 [Streptomyces sp. NPDC035033]|uniref:hypothetical protein n=1 Tax=Streptomyces sp. NPDC035033 TaxID=3155368 RepID=UPI0033C0AC11
MKTTTRTGPPSFGRVLMVATAMLMLELTLVAVVSALYGATQEAALGGDYGLTLMMLPVVALPGSLAVAVAALLLVVPTVVLAQELGRRTGHRPEDGPEPWWWVPVSAAGVAVVGGLLALRGFPSPLVALAVWAALVALIVPAALVARLRRRWLLRGIALWGTAAVVGTAVLGGLALGTGVLTEYKPPAPRREALVGTWTDGRGGTLELAADGTLTADGVMDPVGFAPAPGETPDTCTGRGTWTYRTGSDSWGGAVSTDLPDCGTEPWELGGTAERIALQRWGLDGDKLAELTRVP